MTDKVQFISRKHFLRQLGLTVGGVSAGAMALNELMAVPLPLLDKLAASRGEESFLNTICGQCSAGCGLSVRRIDGIPVGVKGNPIFPVNRGGVCPMAHSALETLFHPDRVRSPMEQLKPGDGSNWTPTDWESALGSVSHKMRELAGRGQGHRIAMINGSRSRLMQQLGRHLMGKLKSPNYFETHITEATQLPVELSHGASWSPIYDLARSKYILNFGDNLIEEGASPVYHQRQLAEILASDPVQAEMTYVDSRLNLTASKADQWVPITPGTYGALALGIAHVLIVDRLYDRDFTRRHAHGFNSYVDEKGNTKLGFEALVKANYYPEKVEEITGVPAQTIIEMGEKFGTRKPAVAIAGNAVRYATNGTFSQWAVYCLNALVANIQQPGGVYFQQPHHEFEIDGLMSLQQWESGTKADAVGSEHPKNGLSSGPGVEQFLETVAEADDSPVELLFIVNANPLYHSPRREQIKQALAKVEQVVIVGTFLDETAQWGHLFLPEHTWLETSDLSGPLPGLAFDHVGYQQPLIDPLFDTRNSGDIILSLGKQSLGNDAFSWSGYSQLVEQGLKSLYDSAAGAVVSQYADVQWLSQLRERGWQLQQYDSFAEFFQLLKKNGGWWNPIMSDWPENQLYANRSGKFEFISSYLEDRLAALAGDLAAGSIEENRDYLLAKRSINARGDHLLLPHYEALPEDSGGDLPLLLTTSWLLTNPEGLGAAQPSMLEMVGVQWGQYWQSWLEVNPMTARAYRLLDHEMAWVESRSGRLQVKVRHFEGIRPGVVHLHMGLGHTALGRYGQDVGVNVADILEPRVDALSGEPALNGTRVKVVSG